MKNNNFKSFKKPIINRYRLTKEVKPITICIVAICDINTKNPKIIHCSDKKRSSAYIEYESGVEKLFDLTTQHNCFIMSSGETGKVQIIVDNVNLEIISFTKENKVGFAPIGMIAEWVKKYYKIEIIKRINDEVLSNYGLSMKTLPEKIKLFSDVIALKITDEIKKCKEDFGIEFLVFGIEGIILNEEHAAKPCLYQIHTDGDMEDHSHWGFSMIGSGKYEAEADMTRKPYSPEISLGNAVQRVYFAKKWSDRCHGVGPTTDLGVIIFAERLNKNRWTTHHAEAEDILKELNSGLSDEEKSINEIREKVAKKIDSSSKDLFNVLKIKKEEEL